MLRVTVSKRLGTMVDEGQAGGTAGADARTEVMPPELDLPPGVTARLRSGPAREAGRTIRQPSHESGSGASDRRGLRLPRLSVGEGEDVELVVGALLGRGGMGEVHLAEQRSLGREVAIKRPAQGLDTRGHDELVREGMVTGMLEHPNVVPVHLMGLDEDDEPVIVMKRVEGVRWLDLIRDDDHPSWRGTKAWSAEPLMRHLEILLDVAGALELAHSRGWVHRDVKPANVMVGTRGEVYLLDWGIATEVGSPAYLDPEEELPLGTPSYMAPEMVATDGVIDERTDIYLLGACLHEALMRRPPHPSENVFAALQAASVSQPIRYPADVATELAAIANRAMAADKDERFPSVRAFRDAIVDHRDQRHSLALARDGDDALARLEGRLAVLGAEPQRRELVEVHAAFAEARFAYVSALRSWPDNEAARGRLGDLLTCMIRHELSHGSVDAAEVLLEQLPRPDDELTQLVAEQRRERAASAQRLASLLAMERELDANVGRRERFLFFLVAALVGSTSVLLLVPWGGRSPVVPVEPRASIVLVVIVGAGLAGALFIGRRWLLRTAVNRRVVALMFLSLFAIGANRWIAGGAEVDHATIVSTDLLLELMVAATGAVAVDRRLVVLAGGFFAGLVASRLFTDHYVLVFLVSNVIALGAGGLVMARDRPGAG